MMINVPESLGSFKIIKFFKKKKKNTTGISKEKKSAS